MIGPLTGKGVDDVVKKNHCHFHLETVTFENRHEHRVVGRPGGTHGELYNGFLLQNHKMVFVQSHVCPKSDLRT